MEERTDFQQKDQAHRKFYFFSPTQKKLQTQTDINWLTDFLLESLIYEFRVKNIYLLMNPVVLENRL